MNKRLPTIKVLVVHTSLETLHESGFDIADDTHIDDTYVSTQGSEYILSRLTRKQREVVSLVVDGFTRKEIAAMRGVELQSVHQIIPRARKRIKKILNEHNKAKY